MPERVKPLTSAGTCRTYTPTDLPKRIPQNNAATSVSFFCQYIVTPPRAHRPQLSLSVTASPYPEFVSKMFKELILGKNLLKIHRNFRHGSLEFYLYAPNNEYVTLASTRCTDQSTGAFSMSFSEEASTRAM